MKRLPAAPLLLLALLALPAFADTASQQGLDFVGQFLPSCEDTPEVETKPFTTGISRGMTARLVTIKSDDPWCAGLWLEVIRGDLGYVGQPWILTGLEGSPAEKIRKFAWERMKETVSATLADKPDGTGFTPATVTMTTEYGQIPLTGVVDPEGQVFYPGGFISRKQDVRRQRMDLISPVLRNAPRKDGESKVEIVEFSDFECPSCKRASEWLEPLLAEYGDRITYHRVDFPLMSMHPWAFPAALYGRAIYRQDPSKFWLFRKEVFSNQEALSVFSLEDFAKGFVNEQGLDEEQFLKDVASQELRDELLRGVAAGMMAEVNGTPTFWVNGKPVAVGEKGSHLKKVLDLELKGN